MRNIAIFLISILSISVFSADIKVTIEKPEKSIRISDISQRDPNHPEGVLFHPKLGYGLMKNATEKAKAWYNKYTSPVSLIITIENISNKELMLFQEWNSWGYYNLKFIFYDGFHEYWVTKRKGLWYRNFPSWNILKPKEKFNISVALNPEIWNGIGKIKENSKNIVYVRALYEQHISSFYINGKKRDDEWKGSVSSKYYQASTVLPNFKFKKKITSKTIKDDDFVLTIE